MTAPMKWKPFTLRGGFLVALICGLLGVVLPAGNSKEIDILIHPDSALNVTGGDDMDRLKALAFGVGWDFSPDQISNRKLRELGMRWIRCINVDQAPGEFTPDGKFVMEEPDRLLSHLETCRKVGANAHIIIGMAAPDALRVYPEEGEERQFVMGQAPGRHSYWNGDWEKLRAYWKAFFRYVLVNSGFPNARFEVGNEPDIDGQFPRLVGPQGGMGSRQSYEDYMKVYENVARAAREVEEENPGLKVNLGGPALAWAFTFTHGELNWAVEFLKDAAAKKLKVDFLGVHYYGNISSLNGEYPANYPSFADMYAKTREARDQYLPGLPILITEWGASYNTSNKEESLVNASNVGAAWSAAFLNQLLEHKVDGALYLATTDQMVPNPTDTEERSHWGWPSLYVNYDLFGKPWPKAPAHLFQMIRDLGPSRVVVEGLQPGEGLNGWSSVDPKTGEVTVLLWNYDFRIPESVQGPVDMGEELAIGLQIETDGASEGGLPWKWERWLVSADTSNALAEFQAKGKVTSKSELQKVEDLELPTPGHSFRLPSGSLAFIRISRPKS